MGSSHSTTESDQRAVATLTQQYTGTCDMNCQNTIQNVNVDIINSRVGGNISLQQYCSVDANCLMQNAMHATADVFFKAKNSSNAKNASGLMSWFNEDDSRSISRQDLEESITQSTSQHCKLSTVNDMNNIDIVVANSQVGKSIDISQRGSTKGSCQLNSGMEALAKATGTSQNTATSGKDLKGQKKGNKGKMMMAIIGIVALIAILVVIVVIAKVFSHRKKHNQSGQYAAQERMIQEQEMMAIRRRRAMMGSRGRLPGSVPTSSLSTDGINININLDQNGKTTNTRRESAFPPLPSSEPTSTPPATSSGPPAQVGATTMQPGSTGSASGSAGSARDGGS